MSRDRFIEKGALEICVNAPVLKFAFQLHFPQVTHSRASLIKVLLPAARTQNHGALS